MELYNITKFIKHVSTQINEYKQTNIIVDPQVKILINMLSETVTKQLGIIEYTHTVATDKFASEIKIVVAPIKVPFVAVPITITKRKISEDVYVEPNYLNKSHNMYWKSLYMYDYVSLNNKSQIANLQFLYYANHKLVKCRKFTPHVCIFTKDGYIYMVNNENNLVPYYVQGTKQKWQYSNKCIKYT